MLFEVINDKGGRVMYTSSQECIPDKQILLSMQRAGYKLKLDGKTMTKKKIDEMRL